MDLLPEEVSKKSPLWPLIHTLKPGIGCINVFIGLRGTAEELGLRAENLWIFTDSSSEVSSKNV
jgi:all-trans-retinol 13,14-reductase